MRLCWVTDPHFDHADTVARERFIQEVLAKGPDVVVVTGDIGVAHTFAAWLEWMVMEIGKPICFVLGNHDFYGGNKTIPSIAEVRQEAASLLPKGAVYLSNAGVYPISAGTALVGHDGWYDGRYAIIHKSNVRINDHELVRDLRRLPYKDLDKKIKVLADEAATSMRRGIELAVHKHKRVVVATHVAPFPECATYQGRPSDRDWLPWFSSKATGDMLLEACAKHPSHEFLVLCGHSHGGSDVHKLPNLRIVTGAAVYGYPEVANTFEF